MASVVGAQQEIQKENAIYVLDGVRYRCTTYARLSAQSPKDGTLRCCKDCTPTALCGGGGTSPVLALRTNNTWNCATGGGGGGGANPAGPSGALNYNGGAGFFGGEAELSWDPVNNVGTAAGSWISTLLDKGGQVYNVLAYGAIPDDGLSDQAAITAAVAAAHTAGATVFFPPGQYEMTTTLTSTDSGRSFVGAGPLVTVLNYTGTGYAFVLGGSPATQYMRFENMTVQTAASADGAFWLKDQARFFTFKNLYVNGPGAAQDTAFLLSGNTNCNCFHTWDTVRVENYLYGTRFSGVANANHVVEGHCQNTGTCFDFQAVGTDTIAGNDNLIERTECGGSVTTALNLANGAARNLFSKVVSDGPAYSMVVASGAGTGNTCISCNFPSNPSGGGLDKITFYQSQYAGNDATVDPVRVVGLLGVGTSWATVNSGLQGAVHAVDSTGNLPGLWVERVGAPLAGVFERKTSLNGNEVGIQFQMQDNASATDGYAGIAGGITASTAGSEQGYLSFKTRNGASAPVERLTIGSDGTVTQKSGYWDVVQSTAPTGAQYPPAGTQRCYSKASNGLCCTDTAGNERCTGAPGGTGSGVVQSGTDNRIARYNGNTATVEASGASVEDTGQVTATVAAPTGGAAFQATVTLQSNGAGGDTLTGLKVTATDSSTNADTLYGISIDPLGAQAAVTETGLFCGTGWDQCVDLNAPAKITVTDQTGMTITDTTSGTHAGLAIALTQANDGDATDVASGLRVTATSNSNNADTLNGMRVDPLTPGAATERGISVGTGWDVGLFTESPLELNAPTGATADRLRLTGPTGALIAGLGVDGTYAIADGEGTAYVAAPRFFSNRSQGSPLTCTSTDTMSGCRAASAADLGCANCVTLGAETTGDYVQRIDCGFGITNCPITGVGGVGALAVDQAATFAWTGQHTFAKRIQFTSQQGVAGGEYADVANNDGGNKPTPSTGHLLLYDNDTSATDDWVYAAGTSVVHLPLTSGTLTWRGGSLITDGTQCVIPALHTINGGPKVYVVNCTKNAAAALYGDVTLPENYTGGALTFEMEVVHENTAPDNAYSFNVSCQCRRHNDVISNTWSATPRAMTATFSSGDQFKEKHAATSPGVTCAGTCAPGNAVYWRAVMDTAATTTTTWSDVYILGIRMDY
jgi:hypothetical protein